MDDARLRNLHYTYVKQLAIPSHLRESFYNFNTDQLYALLIFSITARRLRLPTINTKKETF